MPGPTATYVVTSQARSVETATKSDDLRFCSNGMQTRCSLEWNPAVRSEPEAETNSSCEGDAARTKIEKRRARSQKSGLDVGAPPHLDGRPLGGHRGAVLVQAHDVDVAAGSRPVARVRARPPGARDRRLLAAAASLRVPVLFLLSSTSGEHGQGSA